jgi:UDPglucose 6-dehydrogenase
VVYYEDPYDGLRQADATLVCTEWQILKNLDGERDGQLMVSRLVIDGRNLYSSKKMQ